MNMDAEVRRKKILTILQEHNSPVSGTKLGELLSVSRQIIVQDIALIRAKGVEILATPQGYILTAGLWGRPQRVIAVKHNPDGIEEELKTIINQGGKILDVIVEHPLYGEMKGLLMLTSMIDLEEYLEKYHAYKAEPLSALTGGVHLHTIEADDEKRLSMITKDLAEKGFLLDDI
jgi:transcriptional regulator of NAD metabolism